MCPYWWLRRMFCLLLALILITADFEQSDFDLVPGKNPSCNLQVLKTKVEHRNNGNCQSSSELELSVALNKFSGSGETSETRAVLFHSVHVISTVSLWAEQVFSLENWKAHWTLQCCSALFLHSMTPFFPSQGLKYNYAKHALLLQIHILFLIPLHCRSDEHHVNNLGGTF